MASPLGGVGNCPDLSGCHQPEPLPQSQPQPQPGTERVAGLRESGCDTGSGCGGGNRWKGRENGRGSREPAAAAARRPPRVRFPQGRATGVARPPGSLQSAGLAFRRPPCCRRAASLRPERRSRTGEGRGEGRDQAEAAEGIGPAGCVLCVGGGWGGGDYVSFSPQRVCLLFIYLFLKKFVMSHITPTSRRRGGSGCGE